MQVRIARKRREALDVVSFDLVEATGAPLPAFSAGSHVDVEIAPGLVRQYSLWSSPADGHTYSIAVLREPSSRGGAVAMHALEVGALLSISAPRNHFELVPAPRTLLFAGGIGITPLLAMAERLAASEADFALHYSARSEERAAFLTRLSAATFADRVHVHFDDAPADSERGRLDVHAVLAAESPAFHLYVCGPGGYIEHVLGVAREEGWPQDHLHVERFTNDVPQVAAEAFSVRVASSGATYDVPAGKSIVEILATGGVEIPTSCEQGVCGTCVTRVLSGAIVHRDAYLSDAERAANDQMTPCCSRGRGLLVLDL